VISVGGIAKQFIVPGWRAGWVVMYDYSKNKVASDLMSGLRSLSQLILGANSSVQACIPRLLTNDRNSSDYKSLDQFSQHYMNELRTNADVCVDCVKLCNTYLSDIMAKQGGATSPCKDILTITRPEGAMYAMLGIDMSMLDEATIKDDTDFGRLLLLEENVSILPGQCFGMRNFIRLVICPPADTLHEAFTRIKLFCARHLKCVATSKCGSSSSGSNGHH